MPNFFEASDATGTTGNVFFVDSNLTSTRPRCEALSAAGPLGDLSAFFNFDKWLKGKSRRTEDDDLKKKFLRFLF